MFCLFACTVGLDLQLKDKLFKSLQSTVQPAHIHYTTEVVLYIIYIVSMKYNSLVHDINSIYKIQRLICVMME